MTGAIPDSLGWVKTALHQASIDVCRADNRHFFVLPATTSFARLAHITTPLVPGCQQRWFFAARAPMLVGGEYQADRAPYVCFVDTSTVFQKQVNPETAELRNVGYVLCDRYGTTLHEAFLDVEHADRATVQLFFLHWGQLLTAFRARIGAYNGTFDLTVLSRQAMNPVKELLRACWSHDIMFMDKSAQRGKRVRKLCDAYGALMGAAAVPYRWHQTMDDCRATRDVFFKLLAVA